MNSEEILKTAIRNLEQFNPGAPKLEIRERKYRATMLPAMFNADGSTTDEVVSEEIEITIFRNKERLFTINYFDCPHYRPLAFDRMLHNIILSGLINHPTVGQMYIKGLIT
jgi:hypothetical protein